jgi:hypothetical protein
MNEQQVIDLLNDTSKYTFIKEKDNYSRYDAFCEEHGVMLEIKCRRTFYDDTLIEKMKYDWNTEYAKDNNYKFLYAVSMPNNSNNKGKETIYLFHPDKLNINWFTKKLPAQTDFGRKEWIDKEIAYIPISDAVATR